MKLLETLGQLFTDIFNSSAKAYHKLEDDEQIAIQKASGWIAIINNNLQSTPDIVFAIIQEKYPAVTKETIANSLHELAVKFKLIADNTPADLNTAIAALQSYLNQHTGNTWIAITKALVSVFSTIINPNLTVIQKVEMVLEYVYQNFIKHKVVSAADEDMHLTAVTPA